MFSKIFIARPRLAFACSMLFMLAAVPEALAGKDGWMPAPTDAADCARLDYARLNHEGNGIPVMLANPTEGDDILAALRGMETFETFAGKARFAQPFASRELFVYSPDPSASSHRFAFYRGTDAETGSPVWGVTLDQTGDCSEDTVRLVPPDAAAILQARFDGWDAIDHPPQAAPGLDMADWQTLDFSGDSIDTSSIVLPPSNGVLWLRHDFVLDSGPVTDLCICELTLPLFNGQSDIFLNGTFTVAIIGPLDKIPLSGFHPLHAGTNTLAARLYLSPPDEELHPRAPTSFVLRVTNLGGGGSSSIPLCGTWHGLALPPVLSEAAP